MLRIPYQWKFIDSFSELALIPIQFLHDVFLIRIYVMRINGLFYITMDGPDGELFTMNFILKFLNSLRWCTTDGIIIEFTKRDTWW